MKNYKKSFRVATDLNALERIQVFVQELDAEVGLTADLVFQVNLVLEEWVVNVINYGFRGDPNHEIEIHLNCTADSLEIELIDDAPPFNPLDDAPNPDLTSTVDSRPVGGLGIYLLHTLMDEIRYKREGDLNRLTIIKKFEG